MRRTIMKPAPAPVPRPTASTRPFARSFAVAGSVALAVTLAGCTGAGPNDEEQPAGVSAPTSLVGAECAELVNLDDVRGVLGDAVEPVDNLYYPGGTWPMASVGLRQAGGLQCEWSDAADQAGQYEALLEIDVLPNAGDQWDAWVDEMRGYYPQASADGTVLTLCSSSLGGSYHYCKYDLLAGGSWATISVSNIAADADPTPIVESITAALSAAGSPEPEWVNPGLEGMPASCGELLSIETIRGVLGVDDMDEREAPLLMPFLTNAGLDGALNCSWSNPYTSAVGSPLQVVVLPGGAWAWDAAWAAERPDHSPAEAVEGLGDAAFAGCQEVDNPTCFLDVRVGETWVSLDGKGAVNEATLTELAAEVLASLGVG